MNDAACEALKGAIVVVLERKIRPLLPPAFRYKLTLIARTEDAENGNILISENDEEGAAAVLAGKGLE